MANLIKYPVTANHRPWYMRIYTTKGDKDSRGQFSNVLLFATDLQLGDPKLVTLADNVAAKLATIMHPQTRILRAVMGEQVARGDTKGSRSKFMSVAFNHVGTRTVPANGGSCALDIVANFTKSAVYGPKGDIRLRGVYDEKEIIVGETLHPTTVDGFDHSDFDTFAAQFEKVFEDQNCIMILPAIDNDYWKMEYRWLSSFDYTGVTQRQLRNHRRTLALAEKDVFKREMHNLVQQVKAVLKTLGAGADIVTKAKAVIELVSVVLKAFSKARVLAALPAATEATPVIVEAIELLALAA